ncbi:MAG: tRNA (adenosine(37)-N6)-threonylcarbamoyltransferase complex dimerization subunit type 1 TsaB [Gammaproteobacteria bacterium]
MKLLAIETATEACSCALLIDGICEEIYDVAPRRHAELILPMVSQLLAAAELVVQQLDGIAFGRGPGAFTGVRIAAGVAQGLAFGADLPVAPVSTLQALAQGAYRARGAAQVLTALDARMGEIYWGAYEVDGRQRMATILSDSIAVADQVPLPKGGGWFGTGSGWESYGRTLSERIGGALWDQEGKRFPQAQDVALLAADTLAAGEGVAAEQALPIYLRNRVASERTRRP